MNTERRKGKPPIPEDVRNILSISQKKAIKELQTFGWVIDYVRHPLFQDPRVVVRDPDSGRQAMVMEDGTVDYSPEDLAKRSSDQE